MIRLTLLCFAIALLAAACQPKAPAESDVRAQLIGNYCNDTYSLYINDKTYRCIKYSPALLGSMPITESCEAPYSLVLEGGVWMMQYERDPDPKGINHCAYSFPVWDAEKGFVWGENGVKIKEPFNNSEIAKGGCED